MIEASQNTKGQAPGLLRALALSAIILAALASFALMLNVGHYHFNILTVLFTLWDLSPFVALIVIELFSKHWHVFSRVSLYCLMLIVAASSVTIYGSVVLRAPAQPAFAFLLVPLVSWVFLVAVVLITHVASRRMSGRHEPLWR